MPEISTIGTPTPGWVPEPTNTTLDSVGCRLPGRNGPVCEQVCAAANGVPAAMPGVGPVGRGDHPLDLDAVGEAEVAALLQRRDQLVRVAPAEAAAPVERRHVAGWAPGAST